jgi:predicted ArsR family transcriptional regulator
MLPNQSVHVQRLYDSLLFIVGKQAADDFASALPLSKSANIEQKFKWAEDMCAYLENRFDDKTIREIRQRCKCENGISKANNIKTILKNNNNNLSELANQYKKEKYGADIEVDGDSLLYISPTCYCACIKRIDKPISKTWCYCTLGFVKSIFEQIFGEVNVELLETIKSGSTRCIVRITKKDGFIGYTF